MTSDPASDFLIQVQAASNGRWWSMTAEEREWFILGYAAEQIATLRLLNESFRVDRFSWLNGAEEAPTHSTD